MKFGFMILHFFSLANMFGKGINQVFRIGAGFSALGKGLASCTAGLGKFLVIGGVALGVGLIGGAIFGAFALGRKTGAFKGMKEFEDINIVKVGAIVGIGAMSLGFVCYWCWCINWCSWWIGFNCITIFWIVFNR